MSDTDPATDAPTGVASPDSPLADPAPEPEQEDKVTLSKAELDALRRGQAEAERRAKRLEAEAKKREEDEAAKQGEFQKLAEQRAAELEQERQERTRVEREQRVSRIAARLKFIDPQDAVLRVRGEDGDTEDAALAALERVAEQSPHLIQKDPPAVPEIGQVHEPSAKPAGTGPQPPAGKAPLRTQADVEALSDAEFTARYQEVEAVLRSAPQ